MNSEKLELSAKKCIRCKLPFKPENEEDTICRECIGELRLQDYEENIHERPEE